VAEMITPAAHAILERLENLGPNQAAPSIGWDIATELSTRKLAIETSTGGLCITALGREYLDSHQKS